MAKAFRIPASQIRIIAPDRGGCLASDRITVQGRPVGFMYREEPDEMPDSGWRFFAGDEDDAYTSNAANFEIYDVNTIANCDASIVPLLDAPVGSAFIRDPESGKLVPDDFNPPND